MTRLDPDGRLNEARSSGYRPRLDELFEPRRRVIDERHLDGSRLIVDDRGSWVVELRGVSRRNDAAQRRYWMAALDRPSQQSRVSEGPDQLLMIWEAARAT